MPFTLRAWRTQEFTGKRTMEAMHSNPFSAGSSRSQRDKLDNKLRLALGRGLAAAYAEVLREPIPERMQFWIRQLEARERHGHGN